MNIRDVEIEGKEVLEVGLEGEEGELDIKEIQPKSLLAVDYSDEAIRLSQGWFSDQDNLEFRLETLSNFLSRSIV